MKEFGTIIRDARKEHGYTIEHCAELVNTATAHLAALEGGRHTGMSEGLIKNIAKVLELDPDWLLAKANKIAFDVQTIILKDPVKVAALIREHGKKL